MGKGADLFNVWQTTYIKLRELQSEKQKLYQTVRIKLQNLQNLGSDWTRFMELTAEETEQRKNIEEKVLTPLLNDYALDKLTGVCGEKTKEEEIFHQSLFQEDNGLDDFLTKQKNCKEIYPRIKQQREEVLEFSTSLFSAEEGKGSLTDFDGYLSDCLLGPSPLGPSPLGPSPLGPSPLGPSPLGLSQQRPVTKTEVNNIKTAFVFIGMNLEERFGAAKKAQKNRDYYDKINVGTSPLSDFRKMDSPPQLQSDLRIDAMRKALTILDRDEKKALLQDSNKKKREYTPTLPKDPRDFTRAVLLKRIDEVDWIVLPPNPAVPDPETVKTIFDLLRLGWRDLLKQYEKDISQKDLKSITEKQPQEPRPVGYSARQDSENQHSKNLEKISWYEEQIKKLNEVTKRYPQYEKDLQTMVRANQWLSKLEKMKVLNEREIPFAIAEQTNHSFKTYLDPLPRLYVQLDRRRSSEDLINCGETPIGMNYVKYVQMTKLAEEKSSANGCTEGENDQKTDSLQQTKWDEEAKKRIDDAACELEHKSELNLVSVVGDFRNCMDALIEYQFKCKTTEGPGFPIKTGCLSDLKNPLQTLEEQIEVLSRVMQNKILSLEQDDFNKLTEKNGVLFAPEDDTVLGDESKRHEYGKLFKEKLGNLRKLGLRIWKNNKMKQYAKEAEVLREELVKEFKKMNDGKVPNQSETEEIRKIALWQVMSKSEDMCGYLEAHKVMDSALLLRKYNNRLMGHGTSIMGINRNEFERRKSQLQDMINELSAQVQQLLPREENEEAEKLRIEVKPWEEKIEAVKIRIEKLPYLPEMEQVEELRKLQLMCYEMKKQVPKRYKEETLRRPSGYLAITKDKPMLSSAIKPAPKNRPAFMSKSESIRRYYLAQTLAQKQKKVPNPEHVGFSNPYLASREIHFEQLSAQNPMKI